MGTIYYIAPEVLGQSYTEKCDIWSLGVILYFMITGDLPFDGQSEEEITEKIYFGDYDTLRFAKEEVSEECVDFLKSLLCFNPENRLSAKEALEHEWLRSRREYVAMGCIKFLKPQMVQNMRDFSLSSLIQREMSHLMVKAFNDAQEISIIKAIF